MWKATREAKIKESLQTSCSLATVKNEKVDSLHVPAIKFT